MEGDNFIYTVRVDEIQAKEFEVRFDSMVSSVVGAADQDAVLLEHERLHLRIGEYMATKAAAMKKLRGSPDNNRTIWL